MLIILTGLPAVGKSTFSKNLSILLNEKNIDNIILGTDLIREQFTKWNPKYEEYIKQSTDYLISNALKKNYFVIVDDTNYYNSKRRDLITIADKNNKNHIIIYLEAPLDILLSRNVERGSKIPNEVITNMYDKFDKPGTKYNWDKPDIIVNTTKEINYDNIVNNIINKSNSEYNKNNKNKTNKNSKINKENINILNDIDKITRNIVGEYIKNNNINNEEIKKILNLRKEYIKSIKNKNNNINRNNINIENIKKEFRKLIYDNFK